MTAVIPETSPVAGGGEPRRAGRRPYETFRPGRAGRVVRAALLLLAAIVTLFPFYVMVVLSLKPVGPVTFPGSLAPTGLTTEAFGQILGVRDVLRWALNTLVYSVVSVVGVLFLVSQAGGVNTYWCQILPTPANAQAVFLIRQFVRSLPDSLFEAATIDGCSEWRIYRSIVLPLIKPILATLGVFVFLWHWNDFLWPLIVGQAQEMRTLTTGLASLNAEQVPLSVVLAGSVVAFVPIFMAYLVGQRYFTEGITMTGQKG
ncbi:carbohydrate ABC transporter permease [Jiangella anatolica]|uniref:ABC transporter permease n=1 Tax=Jiangella anatolica TaxID=2670374 RepID=A0A2W2B9H5_9ACTN|nr:carbohydrate ABC transporter permease [Jiangella anatolica]PZF83915.1 ABC transporter permease [Jiangella anatolica]